MKGGGQFVWADTVPQPRGGGHRPIGLIFFTSPHTLIRPPNLARQPVLGSGHGQRPLDAVNNVALNCNLSVSTSALLPVEFPRHTKRWRGAQTACDIPSGHTHVPVAVSCQTFQRRRLESFISNFPSELSAAVHVAVDAAVGRLAETEWREKNGILCGRRPRPGDHDGGGQASDR